MKKFLSFGGRTPFFLLLTALAVSQTSCFHHIGKGSGPIANHKSKWLNWNLIFKEGTDSATRQRTIAEVTGAISGVSSTPRPIDSSKQYPAGVARSAAITVHPLTSYLSSYLKKNFRGNPDYSLDSVEVTFCSCHDTLLWNVSSALNIGGSGQSIPNPPPPKLPGASGDVISSVDSNGLVSSPSTTTSPLSTGTVDYSGNVQFTDSVVLGVIDTGIDSTLFSQSVYSQLFASGNSSKVNFVPGLPSSGYLDDDPVRHGSAVAAIALNAFYTQSENESVRKLPRLMVLKALDNNGQGSTFTVSCALSYAVRHKASLINASLGYYNAQNETINHYLRICARAGIPVVAAAGNDPRAHINSLCTDSIDAHNRLGKGNLFFPACQSTDRQYCIIAVTGLSSPLRPCRYQNFSSEYVSVGVVNKTPGNSCCGFSLPFIKTNFLLDGSSFATPVISGQLAFRMMRSGRRSDAPAYVQLLQTSNVPDHFLTWNGQYISY